MDVFDKMRGEVTAHLRALRDERRHIAERIMPMAYVLPENPAATREAYIDRLQHAPQSDSTDQRIDEDPYERYLDRLQHAHEQTLPEWRRPAGSTALLGR